MRVKFRDKDNRQVNLTFKKDNEVADGNHVLAIPTFKNQLLFTKHNIRGIEFPGGKREHGESSIEAVTRELYEETGAKVKNIHYIAQYTIDIHEKTDFVKDVYFIEVESLVNKKDYLETAGPVLFKCINDIELTHQSFLLQDSTILKCVERVQSLGFYQT
ncbi:phosphohydrolase [Staphylococcus argenteus]|nr:nucleoside triphosphatase YtkD [Staphylococcus argenteus]OMH92202.1 nucleoside triphosphatase YtkD [Staphylococcus argenteus]CDR58928.1 phosphohydrolase [Staphylococcus argenteus]SGW66599.1 phosphohydrolase [Staphylococcus argenteus]SGW75026.1 phosphohydrolase [Staphylococcus argenteus]SGX03460.1 phosphohydrolase [Staphylococcus argenteus]